MLPPDGLCDLLFYTDVWFLDQDFHGRNNAKSWKVFVQAAPGFRRTGFGISASYREVHSMREALADAGREELLKLYRENIRHHGILRVTGTSTSLKMDISGRLELIKDLKAFQEEASASSPVETTPELVLGIRFTNYLDKGEVSHHPSTLSEITR
ncbi:hypothetical protein HPB48_018828 [Haemaphysalis longicornis]|uniref:Uncharacterized protein n=1 Tax=Haemaphysalis longicornis TaxID=44386 RepID=A0A9J6FZI8_HAELO|nr:hypothetical protein HPB48_018828 [Haemaphysalis longicornis]